MAPDAAILIAARAVQGIGSAAVTPLALTILAKAFPAEKARGDHRDLRRHQRPRGGKRPSRRRRRGPGTGLAVDLLDQRADRRARVRGLASLPPRRGVARPQSWTSPAVPLIAGGAAALAWARWYGSGTPGGATVTRSAPSPLAPRCWPDSCCGSSGPPSRCCRCDYSEPRVHGGERRRVPDDRGDFFPRRSLPCSTSSWACSCSPLATGLRLLPWTATPMVVAPLAQGAGRPDRHPAAHARRRAHAGGRAGWLDMMVRVAPGRTGGLSFRWSSRAWASPWCCRPSRRPSSARQG